MPRLRWIFLAVGSLLIFLIISTVLFFELERIATLMYISVERNEQLAEKQSKVNEYREQIEFYSTDEGIAYLGREQYNFIFPGERIFVISNDRE
ncbi:MAG: septum formation initiator [Synergistaceae bacterium]|nr:septum formation initiator [Synergistaceae bacterium]